MITRLLLAIGVAILAMDIHSLAKDMRRLRELAERENDPGRCRHCEWEQGN